MTDGLFFNIIKADVYRKNRDDPVIYKEVDIYENDIPTKEKTESKSSWFQIKNEHSRWKKSTCCKKSKRKKEIVSLGRRYVAFSSLKIRRIERMKYSESLKKNKDFQAVYRTGRSCANKYLVMYIKENECGRNRLGISVSKKVGNSIVRHRLTRLIRESYRLNEERFRCGLDMVVIARAGAKERSYHEIESALLHLGRLHEIID